MISFTTHLIIWSLGVLIFAVYLATISPSIAGGDSGEIVAEGCQLGTAHPPGYPVMTLLVYALSQLSFLSVGQNVALRVNIFCSACTACAAMFMAYMVVKLSPVEVDSKEGKKSSAMSTLSGVIISMLMFAFSPLIWQYAITAEVFPLNTFFAALILYLVVWYSQVRSVSIAYLGAFVCGVALCNQHTILLYEGPLVLWILFTLRYKIQADIMVFVKLSIAFIIGFSPYLYLPIAASISPKAGSWGHVTSWSGFLHHFLRKDYGTFQLFSGAAGKKTEGFAARTAAYLTDATSIQGLHFSTYIAALGVIVSIVYWLQKAHQYGESKQAEVESDVAKSEEASSPMTSVATPSKGKKIGKPISTTKANLKSSSSGKKVLSEIREEDCRWTPFVLLLTQVVYFGVFHTLANLPLQDKLLYGVHQRFWMQPNVLLFTWAGIGFNSIIYVIQSVMKTMTSPAKKSSNKAVVQSESSAASSSTLTPLFHVILIAAAIALSYLQFSTWYDMSNQQNADYFKRYATALLSPLPPNAILLINYDQQWTSVRYMQVCEGLRSDVTSLQLSMMTYKWFQHKHDLYQYPVESGRKNLTFPGTYSTYARSPSIAKENAFTLHMFLDANYDQHDIFLGGKINYPDEEMSKIYDSMPFGMVSKFVRMTDVPKGDIYSDIVNSTWTLVSNQLEEFPDPKKYTEETWEWTIYRDYRDRVTGKSTLFGL